MTLTIMIISTNLLVHKNLVTFNFRHLSILIIIKLFLSLKTYHHLSDKNCLTFSLSPGVNYLIRKMAGNVTSTVQLVKEGENSYSFNTVSTFKNQTMKFTLNEEFEEETMDGRKVKSLVTFEGNKMIQQQQGDKAVRIEREFSDDELITKCIVADVVATRWFKAIE